jgi:uncharacterized protein (TIGR02117 family)
MDQRLFLLKRRIFRGIMKKIIYTSFRILLQVLLILISVILHYTLVAIILSAIPYNADFKSPAEGIDIYILSNGVHTDIVVPAKNKYMDWTQFVKTDNTLAKDSNISFTAFGWGDKGFYLETPSWNDLKLSTAIKAMFALSTSAMHVCNYKSLTKNKNCKKIRISKESYKKLVAYILSSFYKDGTGNSICIQDHHYNTYDAFYEARGNYSLLKTCNTWVNKGLKVSGIRSCVWTPVDKGIFLHY